MSASEGCAVMHNHSTQVIRNWSRENTTTNTTTTSQRAPDTRACHAQQLTILVGLGVQHRCAALSRERQPLVVCDVLSYLALTTSPGNGESFELED